MGRKNLYPLLPGGLLNKTVNILPDTDIPDCAITSSELADSAVTYAKIQTVTGSRLLGRFDTTNGVVQEISLGSGLSFDTDNDQLDATTALADCSVLTQHIKDSAVSTVKLLDSNVTTAKLDGSSVTTAKLADSAVTTAKISDSQVTYAKMQAVTAVRLLGRQDAASGVVQEIPLSAEMRFDTDNDWMEIADCGITTSLMKDSAISTVKLLDSAVTAAKLDATSVTTAKINDAAVTSAKLGDTSVTTAKINDAAITASKHYDTTIPTRVMEIHISDTTLTVGDTYATFFIPAEFDLHDIVRAEMAAKISSTSGNPTIQLRNVTNAADILSTKITLDTGEKTSYTAATPSVINTSNDSMATGDEIAVDVDSAGTAEDVYLILSFRKP